tara:strand:- start:854 stop:1615 length:762 start_codon:yes stop_codon:yes gene_type:complete
VVKKINLKKYFVIILAAGMGRRLGKAGKNKPKTLTLINNKSILDSLVKKLINYKVKKIHFVLGYKSKMILKNLKNFNLKFSYNISDKFQKTGHGYSWYLSERKFKKYKKPVIIIHADILFSVNFLKNIITSHRNNIIGSKIIKDKNSVKNIFKISTINSTKISRISRNLKIKRGMTEVIGINKISFKTQKEIFSFLREKFKDKQNLKLGWEDLLDKYICSTNDKFYILQNQNFNWININKTKDIIKARKMNFG